MSSYKTIGFGDDAVSNFYRETNQTMMLDLELDEVRTITDTYRKLRNPEQLTRGKEDALNSDAHGSYTNSHQSARLCSIWCWTAFSGWRSTARRHRI